MAHACYRRVKITTTLANHVLEGTIFAADPVLNAIAINTTPAPPNPSTSLASQPGNFHVVSIPNIQEFKILPGEDGSPDGFENAMPTIAALDLNALKAREESAVRKLLEKEATRGRGVPKEAQEIFDAINRTYVQRSFFFPPLSYRPIVSHLFPPLPRPGYMHITPHHHYISIILRKLL